MSGEVCHGACFAQDYRPPQQGRDEPCDDEAGAWHFWDTICASAVAPGPDVFEEYGTSEPLVAESAGPFRWRDCRRCVYRNLYFGDRPMPGLTVFRINTDEKCPAYMPKKIGGKGGNEYWNDWEYLNSCYYAVGGC